MELNEATTILSFLKEEPLLIVLTILVGGSLFFMFRLASKLIDNQNKPKN